MEPAAPSEDTAILTVVDDDLEVESLYDVPYVLVNRVGAEIHAEIVLSGVNEIDFDRITTAQSVAWDKGRCKAYARVFGDLYEDLNVVTMLFTDDPSKGLIWALEEEMLVEDWLN